MATPIVVSPHSSSIEGRPIPIEGSASVLSPQGLVSIIVPCCGMLEYTKLCLPSLLRYTRPPYELIFLDIGSLDGTREYLAGIQTAAQLRIEIVSTATDLGIPEATREALSHVRGQYVVLLNNDTIVTEHWLEHLVGLANMSPAMGLVGPMSNYAVPPQLVETVPYRVGRKRATGGRPWEIEVEAMQRFAQELYKANTGKWEEAERLGGFCLLIKRVALDRIAAELYGSTDLGLFDSDIVSNKARQAGFTLACCRDLFIHHFGARTFAHGAPPEKKDKPTGQR